MCSWRDSCLFGGEAKGVEVRYELNLEAQNWGWFPTWTGDKIR